MNTHKHIKLFSCLTCALILVGCEEWIYPQKLDFYRQTPEEEDAAKYAEYLENTKAYKSTEHNVMIVGMEGTSVYPSSQCQHLMAMPDSADYIVVRLKDSFHEKIVEEIPQVYLKKGTKVIVSVDYATILESWKSDEDEKTRKGEKPGTETDAETYFQKQAGNLLALCNKYGFHGVMISFQGSTNAGFDLRSHNGFMNAVKTFHSANPDKVMIFRGTVRNVVDQEFLNEFKYHVIVAGENKSLSLLPGRILGYSAPVDRVIFELTVPSSENPEQIGLTPVEAAHWLVSTRHSGYEPKGLAVENAHDDYFNKERAFGNILSAISLMNPVKQ